MKTVYRNRVEGLKVYIQDYWRKYGRLPTYRQILAAELGYHSMATVAADIRRMKEEGVLFTDDEQRTSIIEPRTGRPSPSLVGSVPCGAPVEAVEEKGEDVSALLFAGHPEDRVMITARGDSMTGRGIKDGDTLIVRLQQSAEPGEIVIAMIDGESTCKTFAKDEAGRPYLKAENPEFRDIHPDHDWDIYGVVKFVIHPV